MTYPPQSTQVPVSPRLRSSLTSLAYQREFRRSTGFTHAPPAEQRYEGHRSLPSPTPPSSTGQAKPIVSYRKCRPYPIPRLPAPRPSGLVLCAPPSRLGRARPLQLYEEGGRFVGCGTLTRQLSPHVAFFPQAPTRVLTQKPPQYFEEREKFDPTSYLKNPMVLMVVMGMVMTFAMPKMAEVSFPLSLTSPVSAASRCHLLMPGAVFDNA